MKVLIFLWKSIDEFVVLTEITIFLNKIAKCYIKNTTTTTIYIFYFKRPTRSVPLFGS